MTEAEKVVKKRRTSEELKAYHAEELKKLERKEALAAKAELLRLHEELMSLQKANATKPWSAKVGQVVGIVLQAANEIKDPIQ